MRKYTYIRLYVPKNVKSEQTVEVLTRAEFETLLNNWNRVGGGVWLYEEKKETKLRKVTVTRSLISVLELDIPADTDECAAAIVKNNPNYYNWDNARPIRCDYKITNVE